MDNQCFQLKLSAKIHGKAITSLKLYLSIEEELLSLLSQQNGLHKFFTQYHLSHHELIFLQYWMSLSKDSKKEIILNAPFPYEFLTLLGSIPATLYIQDQEISLRSSSKSYSPKIHLDITSSSISFQNKEKSLLLPSTFCSMIIVKDTVMPLYNILPMPVIEELYISGQTNITPQLSYQLMHELEKNNSCLGSMVSSLSVIEATNIIPAFEFEFDKQNNKYELSIFLEAEHNQKKELFSLYLEAAQKSLKAKEPFALKGSNNTVLVIQPNTEIYQKVEQIVTSSFQNFYSVLGEIQDNKIVSDDKSNLFEQFLPKVSENAQLYRVGKKKKLKFTLITQDPDISIQSTNKTPIFGSSDWLAIGFEYNYRTIKLTLKDLEKIINQGFFETEDSLITISEKKLDPIRKLLDFSRKKSSEELQIQGYFLPWILTLFPDIEIPNTWKELKEFIQDGILPDIQLPEYTQSILRDYQKIGVERLSLLHKFGFGIVLADEMGLGKTLQILALLDLYQKNGQTLIVTPSALTLNWYAEIQKFYPERFRILIVTGSKVERNKKLEQMNEYDIIITSYHMLGSDLSFYKNMSFDFFIIDEAQHIKNKKAKRSKSVKSIDARSKIAVSGTPLENNITELWSIFDFVMPGFLGSNKQFQHDFEEPLKNFDTEKRKETLTRLYQMCSPFIIRRTKSNVYKELPPKIEQTIITELTEKQKTLYLETLSRVRNHFFSLIEERRLKSNHIDFLSALTKLRQITLHPSLVYPELANEHYELISSKMATLMELLDEAFDSGHRVLIFSQFVSLLSIVKKELDQNNTPYLYIDGKTKNRVELVEEFNNGDHPVFLISLKAGGVGLNLTGADTVILFDPWWNPAVENQAIDRAHRIGQHKTVNVYRLMTKGTIEEKIFNLQRKKNILFENIMQENPDFGTFSSEELLSLLANDEL